MTQGPSRHAAPLMPARACDSHIHFYRAQYPSAPTALLTPPDAWVEDYRKFQAQLGLDRVVVVQPTTYGKDNACQLEAMAAFGQRARGVVVVDRSISDRELAQLGARGVRGVRFHMLPGGALPWDALDEVAARVADLGWHVQLQLNGRELPDRLSQLLALPAVLVVDHVGRFMPPVSLEHPAFAALARLLDTGHCWVKLSAPYESSRIGPPNYEDVARVARELVRIAPERMLWASNWPHPGQRSPPQPTELVSVLHAWVEDEATRERILVDNPADLYGF